MKKIIFISFLSLFLFNACDPFHTKIEDQDSPVIYYEARTIKDFTPATTSLNIVTWNIKFGGGRIDFFFDCHGDRVLMTKAEVLNNMKGIASKINQMNADVIFLQEVDIDSKRSAYVDQVQYLLDNTNMNYAVYASQWQADYVPSDGVGQVNSGNAILSKYPLTNAERIALPLIAEQSGLVNYFYLRRNILQADIMVNNKTYAVLNTHTEAYSSDDTKKQQLDIIKERVEQIDNEGKKFILGGDFNNLPPNTTNYCNFDDDACPAESPYASLPCNVLLEELSNMLIFSNYDAAIPQSKYDLNQPIYATFTSDKNGFWNRKLDYIFTNGQFVEDAGMVHQSVSSGGVATMPLSDHAPVSTVFKLN